MNGGDRHSELNGDFSQQPTVSSLLANGYDLFSGEFGSTINPTLDIKTGSASRAVQHGQFFSGG